MDLRQLEYTAAVAAHGGFTKAALALHVAQPSLSQGVRALERELGVELFERLGRGVAITAAGEIVVDGAQRVLSDAADLRAAAAAAAGVQTGRLEVVALPTLAVDPLSGLIGAFRIAHPGVTVRVGEPEDADSVEHQVASGRAELGFADLTTAGRGLVRVELFRQEVVAVSPPGSAFDDEAFTPAAFARLALLATPPGTSTRRLLDRTLARAGGAANVVVETSHREALVPLVLAGAGTTLLPASMAVEAAARGAVVRSLRPRLTRRVGVLHRPGRRSPPATAMLALARELGRRRSATATAAPNG
jgi:LysR family transcriptional regulator, carnitine catabolism transcriptional activator